MMPLCYAEHDQPQIIRKIVSMVRDKKAGKSSCGCNCAKCAMAGKCHPNTKKT